MPDYVLAIDIGASSGRHIVGWLENGTIRLKEIHRFTNGPIDKNGTLVWDVDSLFAEVRRGLVLAGEAGMRPLSVAIDTWGVDFVLLDKNGALIGDAVAYRDTRTAGMEKIVHAIVGRDKLYERTGIQHLIINTVFQFQALKQQNPDQLASARRFLMMPDYLNYLLTGQERNEYTNASTTQLLNAASRDWDADLLRELGFPAGMFLPPSQPGTRVGPLLPEVREAVG
jgi:rhamnulokinase